MPKTVAKLTALEIAKIKEPGVYRVDDGLYFQATHSSRSWLHRFQLHGKQRWSGLGPYPEVGLAEARAKRDKERAQIRNGVDPVIARQTARTEAATTRAKTITFRECAENCITQRQGRWRRPLKEAYFWRRSLMRWAYPIIGDLPAQEVDTPAVLKVLEQIVDGTTFWEARITTADRVRNRIEVILRWATRRKYRSGENPALWRDNLEDVLRAPSKIHPNDEHHPALPYDQLPEFMKALRARQRRTSRRWPDGPLGAKALELLILTAARASEATEARWTEIDFATKTWTIARERMKSDRPHRIPLSPAALRLLEKMRALRVDDFICSSKWRQRSGAVHHSMMLRLLHRMGPYVDEVGRAITVHGFRSTFRTWVSDCTNFDGELAEIALAHGDKDKSELAERALGNAVGTKTRRAYDRALQLEKRRRLMDAWADYCDGKLIPTAAEIIPMRPR